MILLWLALIIMGAVAMLFGSVYLIARNPERDRELAERRRQSQQMAAALHWIYNRAVASLDSDPCWRPVTDVIENVVGNDPVIRDKTFRELEG